MYIVGTSLAVQLSRLRASNAGGTGSIPGGGTKIPHAQQPKKKMYIVDCRYVLNHKQFRFFKMLN